MLEPSGLRASSDPWHSIEASVVPQQPPEVRRIAVDARESLHSESVIKSALPPNTKVGYPKSFFTKKARFLGFVEPGIGCLGDCKIFIRHSAKELFPDSERPCSPRLNERSHVENRLEVSEKIHSPRTHVKTAVFQGYPPPGSLPRPGD